MEGQSKSGPGAVARFRAWRQKRKLAAAKRRARSEEQIAQERYNYSGPGAPGGGG